MIIDFLIGIVVGLMIGYSFTIIMLIASKRIILVYNKKQEDMIAKVQKLLNKKKERK